MEINIEEYKPLIRKVARINKHPQVDIEDAISVATVALHNASQLYDSNRGTWKTYAIASMKFQVWKLKPERGDEEIPLDDYGTQHAINLFQSDQYKVWMRELVLSKLILLDAREQYILTRLFGIDCDEMTQTELANELGIVQSRICFIKIRALNKLKKLLNGMLHSHAASK